MTTKLVVWISENGSNVTISVYVNIGILGNNMIFTVSKLLASVDISVVSNKCITKFLGSLE